MSSLLGTHFCPPEGLPGRSLFASSWPPLAQAKVVEEPPPPPWSDLLQCHSLGAPAYRLTGICLSSLRQAPQPLLWLVLSVGPTIWLPPVCPRLTYGQGMG